MTARALSAKERDIFQKALRRSVEVRARGTPQEQPEPATTQTEA